MLHKESHSLILVSLFYSSSYIRIISPLHAVKAGWGDWAGPGATGVSAKILSIRDRQLKIVEEETAALKKGRRDTKIPNVIISDRRVKTAAKYKISELPHPFKSREEYERSMQMPLGGKPTIT